MKLYPHREKFAETWLENLKEAYKKKYNHLEIMGMSLKTTKEGKKLRWNCLVLMEMVRTGEELPTPKVKLPESRLVAVG